MSPTRWIRIIAVWQMLGGALAAVTFLDAVRTVPAHEPISVGLLLLASLVAVGAALAGVGLYRGRPRALIPSLVVQALQVLGFNLGTGVYQLTLGPYVDATILWGQRASLNVGFMPQLVLRFGQTGSGAAAINLLACWCFWRLLWAEPEHVRALARVPAAPERVPAPGTGGSDPDVAAT